MSNVWGTRYRVLCEQLEEPAKRLGGGKPMAPEVLEELVVRLLTPAVMLLRQHVVNKRGSASSADGRGGGGGSGVGGEDAPCFGR